MSRSVRRLGLVFLALVLMAATACGGGDGRGSGGPAGEPIQIAAIGGLSGGVSSNPEVGEGAQAAVDAINARGGINGRPIELTLCDNHQNATDSANCYREILADDDIVAIVGGSDNFRDASAAQIEAAQMPVVGQHATSNFDLNNALAFNVNGASVVGFHGLAQDVVASGARRIGLVSLDIPIAEVIRSTVGDVVRAAGAEIVNNVQISPSTADLSSSAQQVTQNDPDAVIWLTYTAQTSVAVKALRQTGYTGPVAFAGTAFERAELESMSEGGPLTIGLVLPPAWDTSTKYGKQFNADMAAHAPDAKLTELSQNSWLAVQMFAQATATLPTIDRASVLEGLRKASQIDTGGLTAPIDFSTKSPLPFGGIYNPAYAVVHVTDRTATWDGKLYEYGTRKELPPVP